MAFIVYKCLCWSFLFRFLTTSGKTLLTSPAPCPHRALKIATGVGLAQGFEFGVHSLCPLGHQFTLYIPRPPSFPSVLCVWLKVLRGDVLLDDHFLLTIWKLSGPDTSDSGINNLCCSACASSLRSAVFTTSSAFFKLFFQLKVWEFVFIFGSPKKRLISLHTTPSPHTPKCFLRNHY